MFMVFRISRDFRIGCICAKDREPENLSRLECDRVEVALASENSTFAFANSHLPKPLASGNLIMRELLPTERAMTFAKAARRQLESARALYAKMSKARRASRPADTINNTTYVSSRTQKCLR